jgi:hypothetical protein
MGVQGGGNFWGFLASISPFESWRKYLVFRHKRDQDHRYREKEEARRLNLENDARELENDARELALLEKRAKIAKQLGATNEQLQPLCNRILGCPDPNPKTVPPRALPPKEPLLLTDGGNDQSPTAADSTHADQAGDGLV